MCAHNMLEKMFHPDLFQITRCSRGPNSTQCERGDFCAFAHSEEDLRQPSSGLSAKDKAALASAGGGGGGSFPFPPSLSLSTSFDTTQQPHKRSPGGGGLTPSKAGNSGSDGLSPSKPLTVDSVALEGIQRNLVTLIKSQGIDGIISSELPKRYFDHFGTRLDLQDEHGEKFRIKDILHHRTDVAVSMHKGVQPKYVYCGPDPILSPTSRDRDRAGRGAGASVAVAGDTLLLSVEEEGGAGASSLSFLDAASHPPHSSYAKKEQQERERERREGVWKEGVASLRHTGAGGVGGQQPTFSPSGVGHHHQQQGHLQEREEYVHSPFFPNSSSSSSSSPAAAASSSSSSPPSAQDGLSGLLGSTGSTSNPSIASSLLLGGDINSQSNDFDAGLISPPRHGGKQQSSTSYLENTFKFPLFENGPIGFNDKNDQNGHKVEFSRILNDKNMELSQKTMEIEDLKSKLQDFQRQHHEVCLEHDREKRQFQAKISHLNEKVSSLEGARSSSTDHDSHLQFPQNAFPMSSSRQPFSPQRSAASSSPSPSPSRSSVSWTGDNHNPSGTRGVGGGSSDNFSFSARNQQFVPQQQQQQHSPGSRCGHHGCSAEGTYWCSGCSRVGYCGPEHQAAHWERYHKNECGLYE